MRNKKIPNRFKLLGKLICCLMRVKWRDMILFKLSKLATHQPNNRIAAKDNKPTKTMTNKFLEIIADTTLGIEASKLLTFNSGKWPKCCVNRLLNHKADMITTGTKLKYSTTAFDRLNFFNNTNGRMRDNQVTTPQPMMVNNTNLKEGMLDHHPDSTTDHRHN